MVKFKLILAVLILSSVSQLFGQYMSGPQQSGIGIPYFRSGFFRSFDETGHHRQVTAFIQILNDDLAFLKNGGIFRSEIEYEIFINGKTNGFTYDETFRETIETPEFDKTNSRSIINTFKKVIELPPGDYNTVITLLDRNSNKQLNRKMEFQLEDIDKTKFLISDLIFFSEFEQDSSGKIISIEPNLTSNFSGTSKYLYFHFTSVVEDTTKPLHVSYFVKNSAGNTSIFNQYKVTGNKKYQEHYIKINRQQFDQNRYELALTGEYDGNKITAKRFFSFYWTIVPESPKDLDLAIQQMKYIPDADSIGWALKQSYDVKLAFFKRFWKRMDQNPGTEKNELMDEYYRRVNFTVVNFSSLANDGWRTDRGRIFIKFGQPDDIERHPFEMSSNPYEIWRYYGLRKVFLFLDKTGFGDYYLDPNYLDEEYN